MLVALLSSCTTTEERVGEDDDSVFASCLDPAGQNGRQLCSVDGRCGACETSVLALACEQTVTAFKALQDAQELPRAFEDGVEYETCRENEPVRTGAEFDPNAYFAVLDHLSMEEGYTLDYVYANCWDGWQGDCGLTGYPILYARPEGAPRFGTASEFRAVTSGDQEAFLAYWPRSHLVADGSDEGYLQLIVLDELGAQFYQWWHASGDDTQILCSQLVLEQVLSTLRRDSGYRGDFTPESDAAASVLDVWPRVVSLDEETVAVELVRFTKWGGFTRRRYLVGRNFPHSLKVDRDADQDIEYDCGIMY